MVCACVEQAKDADSADSSEYKVADPALQQLDEALGGVISEFITAADFSGKAVSVACTSVVSQAPLSRSVPKGAFGFLSRSHQA